MQGAGAGGCPAAEETALEQRAQAGAVPAQRGSARAPAEAPAAEAAEHGAEVETLAERLAFAQQAVEVCQAAAMLAVVTSAVSVEKQESAA